MSQRTWTVQPTDDIPLAAQLKIAFAGEMKSAIKHLLAACAKCSRGEKHNRLHTELREAMENYLNSSKASVYFCAEGHAFIAFGPEPCYKCSQRDPLTLADVR